jgi:hypothetical protein
MKEIFRAGPTCQFILTGNIHDRVAYPREAGPAFLSLREFLAEALFDPLDVVLFYDRGRGFQIAKGADHVFRYFRLFDRFHGTKYAQDAGVGADADRSLDHPGLLPRDPREAIPLLDRFLRWAAAGGGQEKGKAAPSVAVVLDYAHFILPQGESLYLGGDIAGNLITVLNWSKDPAIASAHVVTVLVTETLAELSGFVVSNPYAAKVTIDLPDPGELEAFVADLVRDEPGFKELCEVEVPVLAAKLVGLNRIGAQGIILRSLRNGEKITVKKLSALKKEILEKESFDKLEFIESARTLDDVAGHAEAKRWMREDARLLKKDARRALPMGYLLCGRIGTGKTYLAQCFAGECGVPFVELKNFRDKWVGSTEGNLEKVFRILRALGQVVVFVDEADQAMGKRESGEGDSGLSGRIYAMLAKEMADTDNRGRILWLFATSRPDLLEVDLKRQGRLDVHIPLFPPADAEGRRELFHAMAVKLKMGLKPEELPDLPFDAPVSGNELEGLLVRAVREYELQPGEGRKPLPEVLRGVVADFRPSAHTKRLELMDLLAVKECTDSRFLPDRFRSLEPEAVERRIRELEVLVEA